MISPLVFVSQGLKRPAPDAEKPRTARRGGVSERLESRWIARTTLCHDEAICQAVSAMLARVGSDQSERPRRANTSPRCCSPAATTIVLPARLDTRSFDSWNVLNNIVPLPATKKASAAHESRRLLQSEVEELTNKIWSSRTSPNATR